MLFGGDPAGRADPGAVDADPEATLCLGCLRDRRFYLIGVGHVALDESGAQLGRKLLALLAVEVGDRHLVPGTREFPHRGLTEARSPPENDR